MRQSRATSLFLLITFLVGFIQPSSVVNAQESAQIEGQIAYVGQDGNVYLLRSGQSPVQVTHNLGEPMRHVAFSQSGQWLSFINREDNLYIIDTITRLLHLKN